MNDSDTPHSVTHALGYARQFVVYKSEVKLMYAGLTDLVLNKLEKINMKENLLPLSVCYPSDIFVPESWMLYAFK